MTSARIRVLSLAMGDMLTLSAVWGLNAFLYQLLGGNYQLASYFALWPMLLVFVVCAGFIRLYHGNFFYPGMPLSPVEELRRCFFAVTLTYLLLFTYLTLTRGNMNYSRVVLVASWFVTILLIIPMRHFVRSMLKKFNIGQIKVLIAGGGKNGQLLRSEINQSAYFGFKVVGFVDDNPEVPDYLGDLAQTGAVGKKYHAEILLLSLPLEIIQKHLREFMRDFSNISILFNEKGFPISWAYPINLNGISGMELRNQLLLPMPRIIKTLLEIFLAATGIFFLWPVFLVLALIVKLTSNGPILYRAKRIGFSGQNIQVWKFRTMFKDADKRLDDLLNSDPQLAKEWQEKFKLEKDPRITPVGNFLRKSSLDELPQLFNVLRGEMSMIGPRPIVEAEKSYYAENYDVFCRVKPGITGLWQVSGRSNTSYERRVALDMYYVFNWSIWLDLYILAKTFFAVIHSKGAK